MRPEQIAEAFSRHGFYPFLAPGVRRDDVGGGRYAALVTAIRSYGVELPPA